MKSIQFILIIITLFSSSCYGNIPPQIPNSIHSKGGSLNHPPCKACSILTDSFKESMEKTSRGKYEGGDTAWEEEKLGAYRTSKIRLADIHDHLCASVTRGKDQCLSLAGDTEDMIEEWWSKNENDRPDIFDWLCIEQTKVCCPPNHFGPNCDLCSDCNGNGKCKGNGTRKGNGKCSCDTGYTGEFCIECANHYYEAFRDENKLLCSGCHVSCGNNGCTGSGPKNCRNCKHGWTMTTDSGCLDIDECLETPNACKVNQFCINNDGSYSCLECDRSCNGCIADGPDMCKKCAEGYELRDGKCTDITGEKRDQYVNFTRFLTYLGLCIATCVIFQNSTTIACIIGIAVAIYISASEYWLHTSPSSSSNNNPILDTKQIEDMIKNSL